MILYYIVKGESDFYRENFDIFISLIIAGRILKCLIEVYVCFEFVSLFSYFVKRKQKALRQRKSYLSNFNRFIIRWTYFNFGLKVLNAFFVLTILTLYQSK